MEYSNIRIFDVVTKNPKTLNVTEYPNLIFTDRENANLRYYSTIYATMMLKTLNIKLAADVESELTVWKADVQHNVRHMEDGTPTLP